MNVDAALRLRKVVEVTAEIQGAACKFMGAWWSAREADYDNASSKTEAVAISAPVFELCGTCTQRSLCEERAILDRYTGLAAGQVFVQGVSVPVGRRRRSKNT